MNFGGTAVEPSVAEDPTHPNTLIGAWQQDRWSNGGSHDLEAGASSDGGKTWTQTPLPFSACAPSGLPYARASDPVVSMGPDGRAYVAGLSITFELDGSVSSAVAVCTSTDGGRSWSAAHVVGADSHSQTSLNDKDSITADPTRPGVAYVVWDRGDDATDSGPAWMSTTTDGGLSWSAPRVIYSPPKGWEALGNQILVDPRSGLLYDFFSQVAYEVSETGNPATLEVITSADGGFTWSAPTTIATQMLTRVVAPGGAFPVRSASALVSVALDPATGALYAAWEDSRFSGGRYNGIALSRSVDGGRTGRRPCR